MEKITAKEARDALDDYPKALEDARLEMRRANLATSVKKQTEIMVGANALFALGYEKKAHVLAYLNQQVAIEEADAAAVPLSRR